VQAGVSLNPATPIHAVKHVLELCDMVLLMSVNPGFGGQAFIEAVRPKIRELRSWIDERGLDTRIQIDGGVHNGTIAAIAEDGADTFVAGSAVFRSKDHPAGDYAAAIADLRARSGR